jgi:ABC-2 type transport system permease protein
MEDKQKLKTLFYNLKIYLMMSSKYIKARSQYRADFILGMFATVLNGGLGLVSLWILFHSGSKLAGWSYPELFFIYAFTMLATIPQAVIFNHIWYLPHYVRSGQFLKYYFKPINMFIYFMGDLIDIKCFSFVALAIAAFIYASIANGIQWNLEKAIFLLFSTLGSSLIIASLHIATASISLVLNTNFNVLIGFFNRFLEFTKYPASIFKGFIRFIFTYLVPMAFVGYYPALYFLRPQESPLLMYAAPVIGIVMFIGAYQVWRIGVNRYSGTGS